ncbi:serine protease [Oligoflexia bacterium]|nr:serine protease [Oligoflexia bacterium]
MRIGLRLLLWVGTILSCCGSAVSATPLDASKLVNSVFLLSSKTNDTCATGFLMADGELVTNSHVMHALCPLRNCEDVIIRKASRIGDMIPQLVPVQALSIKKDFPGLDAAVLEVKFEHEVVGAFKKGGSATPGQPLFSLGYPRCKALTLSSGSLETVSNLRLFTSVQGAHGSSGSPIFDQDYNLIGIADEAESVTSALTSMLFATDFRLRGVRADILFELTALDPIASINRHAALLSAHYNDSVRPTKQLTRLLAGEDFLHLVEGLRKRLIMFDRFAIYGKSLSWLGEYIALLPTLPVSLTTDPLILATEKIAVAYSLEKFGLKQKSFTALDSAQLVSAINAMQRPLEHKQALIELVNYAASDGYMGSEYYTLLLCAMGVGTALVLTLLWGWSLGYVFSRARGGIIRGTIVMAVVGIVLWPLSFLLFLMLSLRRS